MEKNKNDGRFYTWFTLDGMGRQILTKEDTVFKACPNCFNKKHKVLETNDRETVVVTQKTTPHKKDGFCYKKKSKTQRYACRVCGKYHLASFKKEINEEYSNFDDILFEEKMEINKQTIQVGSNGDVERTWYKLKKEEKKYKEELKKIIEKTIGDIGLQNLISKTPKTNIDNSNKKNMVVLPLFDAHIGVLVSEKEAGYKVGTKQRITQIYKAVMEVIQEVEEANVFYFLNGGDWFHFDNHKLTTSSGKNQMLSDVTPLEMINYGILIMELIIQLLLLSKNSKGQYKFKKIILRNISGNHDNETSHFLNFALWMKYKEHNRIDIQQFACPFCKIDFGNNSIIATHGDTIKTKDALGFCFSHYGKQLKDYVYFFTGHRHHANTIDKDGVLTLQQPVFGKPDIWAYKHNFRSKAMMNFYTFNRDYGKTKERTLTLAEIDSKIQNGKDEKELMDKIDEICKTKKVEY